MILSLKELCMLALDIHDFHLKLQNYLEQHQSRADINHRPTQN